MRRVLFILTLIACSCAAVAAEKEKEIDAVFDWAGTNSGGCALSLLREDVPVLTRSYGMASLEHHIAITPRSVFGIQSTSKQFTAMAVVLLIQDGKLTFDDDVRKYVPELPDYGATITIRHLLEHTSGLRDIAILLQDQGLRRDEPLSDKYLLDLILRQKALNHPPGAAQSYTNSGYFLLALIAGRVAGEPVATFMNRRIFEPLGMRDTRYRADGDSVVERRVTGYRRGEDGVWRISGNARHNVFTTLEDMVRWNGNFAKPVVGGEEAIRWMTTWGKLSSGQTTEWGLGLSPLRYKGLEGYYFSGGGQDGTSLFVRLPQQKVSLIVLCNSGLEFNAEPLGQKVIDIVLANEIAAAGAKTPPAPPADPAAVPVARAELQRYAGLYFSTYGGPWTRDIRELDGKLKVVLSPERSVELIPLGNGRFRAPGSTTEYQFSDGRLQRSSDNEPVMELIRVDPAKPASVDELAGRFYNDEVEAGVEFTVKDGKLHYALPRQEKPSALEPIFRDAFRDGALVFRFLRDSRGRVVAMTKHWDRVWELKYVPQRTASSRRPA